MKLQICMTSGEVREINPHLSDKHKLSHLFKYLIKNEHIADEDYQIIKQGVVLNPDVPLLEQIEPNCKLYVMRVVNPHAVRLVELGYAPEMVRKALRNNHNDFMASLVELITGDLRSPGTP